MTAGRGQRLKILQLLLTGKEVPSVALSRISLQYGARIKELRELGFRIVNRTERHAGQVHGYFHLETGPRTTRDLACASPNSPVTDATGSLFGDLAPDRSYAE